MTDTPPALSIEGLRFSYKGSAAEAWTLDIPSLALAQTEQCLLAGTSGSGKSTLLHLIAGLVEPDAGEIRVDGRAIHKLTGAARDAFRGQRIGMVFQTHHLLHGFSAIENVMMALAFSKVPKGEHRERAAKLLSRLGITRHDATPESLSVGQQQRVAIARALVTGPALVLADEPTASLDPDNAAAAVELLEEACREVGAALLCVSHDPTLVERFPRVERLDELAKAAAVPV